jgi:RimJ/RimL family protein N-acetyltransferase
VDLLQSLSKGIPMPSFILSGVDMPEMIQWADVAVLAGGTTCWEAAFLGLPFLTITLAENQRRVTEALSRHGVSGRLGWYEDVTEDRLSERLQRLMTDSDLRRRQSRIGQRLFDGDGVARVVQEMRRRSIRVRRVGEKDCPLIWEWANDPETRNASFQSGAIPWETHTRWFFKRLASPETVFFIVETDTAVPIGQIRFDVSKEAAEVSVSLDRRFRGRGMGGMVIQEGTTAFRRMGNSCAIHAYVKHDNTRSMKVFLSAGYEPARETRVCGQKALLLMKKAASGGTPTDTHRETCIR